MHTRLIQIGIGIALVAVITLLAFFAAAALDESGWLRSFVESAGVFGILTVAFISGLNAFVPVPPATFAPLFLEAGFHPATVIACFVIGTFLADSVGYALGWFGRGYAESSFPKLTARIGEFLARHARLVMPITFLYFAFAPLPNEIILIPLALAGYSYRPLIVPIILGNIVHHTILVFGYQQVFQFLF